MKRKLRPFARIRSNSVARNSFFLTVLAFSNYLIGLLLFPYISRVLSVEGFGLVGFAMSYAVILQVIVEFGFAISATASISKNRNNHKRISEIVSTVMLAKAILMIVSIFIFILSMLLIPMVRDNYLIISFYALSSLLVALLPDFYFRGIEMMKAITVRTVSIRLLSLLLVVALVKDEADILWIPISFIVANSIALILALRDMHNHGVALVPVHVSNALIEIRRSSLYFLSRISHSINQSMGLFMLGLKFAPTSIEVGLFSGASRLSSASELVIFPLTDSLYPHMVNKKDYKLFKKVVMWGGAVWLLICTIIFIFSESIAIIVLGKDYAAAGDILRVLVFGSFMSFFSNIFGYNALTPIGKAAHANIALFMGTIVSILLFFTLWITDSISTLSVSIVVASTSSIVFLYRFIVLWKNRHLVKAAVVSRDDSK